MFTTCFPCPQVDKKVMLGYTFVSTITNEKYVILEDIFLTLLNCTRRYYTTVNHS